MILPYLYLKNKIDLNTYRLEKILEDMILKWVIKLLKNHTTLEK